MLTLDEYRAHAASLREAWADSVVVRELADEMADHVLGLCDEVAGLREQVECLRATCTTAAKSTTEVTRELMLFTLALSALPPSSQELYTRELARVRQATTLAPKEPPSGEIERR